MENEDNLYKKILNSTYIFGSVQIIILISSLIRSKILAILIGPSGYGLFGLLNSTVDLIKNFTSFAIDKSAVRQIADSKNEIDLKSNANNVYKLSIITGLAGFLITIIFSKLISGYIFGTSEKWTWIIIIGISIVFKQIYDGIRAIIQGKSELKTIAKANLYSNIFNLLITIPLFYIFRKDFIIYAIVITSLINLFTIKFLIRNIIFFDSIFQNDLKKIYRNSKEILHFGSLLILLSFLPILINYLMQIIIKKNEGLAVVGIFNVSVLFLETYVGFLFAAMSNEYYPRLIKIGNNENKISEAINKQATITVLLMTPIIIIVLGLGKEIINLLFSVEFIDAFLILRWAIVGMFFKAISFSIGYIFIAKADSKVFTKSSFIFNIIYFAMLYVGFKIDSLNGIGIAMMIYYLIHLLGVYIIATIRYNLQIFNLKDIKEIFMIFILILIHLFINLIENNFFRYIIFAIVAIFSFVYIIIRINKLIPIKNIFKK